MRTMVVTPRPRTDRVSRSAGVAAALLAVLALLLVAGSVAGRSPSPSGRSPSPSGRSPSPAPAGPRLRIVVTTSILGSLVRDLVGDRGEVRVLMPNGIDPHDWQPSAQDIEAIGGADLVVENGLDLEAGLADALTEARAAGVPVFTATDVVPLRALGEATDPTHGPDDGHDHGAWDPHIWTAPLLMRSVVDHLAPVIGSLGTDVTDGQAALDVRLDALDAEVHALLDPIPPDRRRVVTGHESMGYFADAYGLELVGAVNPGLTSLGEISARQLADLVRRIRDTGVRVILTEAGTPRAIVDAVAEETGARVVALPSHTLPDDGSYHTFILELATVVADALAS